MNPSFLHRSLTRVQYHLPRTAPEQQGIASSAVLQFVEALEGEVHELHSFMLLRHGKVVAEGWWRPYRREFPHMVFSLSKSFTATAVGLAISEGYFSIDDLVGSFFPDETEVSAMRVRHLLSMSTGHADDTWASMVARPDGQWTKSFFEMPVLHPPGTHFVYNTGATYLLSAIVQKATGFTLIDYLKPRLFEPLGIENARWEESPQGIMLGGVGLSLKTEDIARFGQLYLQKGMWQGSRILSEEWVNEATAAQISNGEDAQSDWTQGYGYQFWHCRHGAYRGDGVFGQYCIVMPEQDAVLAITGGVDLFDMQQPLNLVWEILLPAMGDEPLLEATAHPLSEKLSTLSLPTVQGQKVSLIASQIYGRTYRVAPNELKLETISLTFTESGCSVRVKTATGEEIFPCGYDRWNQGYTSLFNDVWIGGSVPIAASGAWTDEDTFTMVVRLYETPFVHTLVYHFVETEMMIEAQVNVSFDSPKTLLLMAHLI